jgi:serine/threonine-protein kinase
MSVPDELYDKRVRGRVALLACRGCPVKIRLDGTGDVPVVGGGILILDEAEGAEASEHRAPASGRQPIAQIGRYALFEQFATGGMATVHFGRLDGAGGFSRVVAIKRLLPHLVKNEDFTQMLLQEARLAARVRHPNVVPTLDVVASKGDVLLVLEYVHGESLSALCRTQAKDKKEHIPLDIAVAVMHGVLQGLQAVHEATDEHGRPLALVHRDISPPNVIVGADGLTRVLDFGIAKALESIEESMPSRVKGKSGYMSPEQIRGERLTQRSDVFSAGIVLWELLATRRLFMGETEMERMQKILDGNYRGPASYRPDLPPALDAVVLRALERDPEKRYASSHDFAVAIEQAAPGAASARKVADWVNELAPEALAQRARMIAQVDTWIDGAGDLPLNSAPFAAEAAVILTAPPPAVAESHPAAPGAHKPASGTPGAVVPSLPAMPEGSSRTLWVALGLVLAFCFVVGYLAFS